ncbi:MAG: glycosyltransferase family 4 protein [Chloroflexales bacterium]|nr:glycosyltransferase family 4 protein [Chloroflexales bacterium]
MRITYLHQYFVPPETSGGTRSYEFARRLIAAGHTVTMITSSAMLPDYLRPRGGGPREMEIAGVPMVVIPVPYANSMGFAARLRAFLSFAALAAREAARRPADVVFATSTPLTIAIPGIVASLARGVPMVFEVRDLWPELPIAIGALRDPLTRGLAQILESVSYLSASHVVALSPGMASGVIRRGVAPERVTVIPNSCDVDEFDIPAERGEQIRRRVPGLAPDQPLIVYSGTFGRINGVSYLVELAAALRVMLPGARVLLVGDGAERSLVEARARELGLLGESVHIWDPIPKAEMPLLLAAADLATSVFLPIQPMWNNSANKFFDALAAGRPIAINYGGWQAALLRESGAGLVLPQDDIPAAAWALAAFLRDREGLRAAAAAASRLAYTRFHRDEMARILEQVLVQAAGQPLAATAPGDRPRR